MYANGEGVSKDYEQAVKYYRLSASQGNLDAQCNLGWIYHEGVGVVKNDSEAYKLTRLAAENGLPQAQYNLGELYYEGEGVSKDIVQACAWWQVARSLGQQSAAKTLHIITKEMSPKQRHEANKLAGSIYPLLAKNIQERNRYNANHP